MKFLLFVIILFVPLLVKADEPRRNYVFTSPNNKFELKAKSKGFSPQEWSLIEKSTGKLHYQVVGDFSAMTVLVSNDGDNLIAVDDFSERGPAKYLEVLHFYRQGKQIKIYSLGELLNDISNISSSVSHFNWFFGMPSISNSTLRLTTYELFHYVFDIKTGGMLIKEQDTILSDGAFYIYGKLKNLSNGYYEMEVCHRIQGDIPANGKVRFRVDAQADGRDKFLSNFYSTVIVKDGKLLVEKDVILNSCNYQK